MISLQLGKECWGGGLAGGGQARVGWGFVAGVGGMVRTINKCIRESALLFQKRCRSVPTGTHMSSTDANRCKQQVGKYFFSSSSSLRVGCAAERHLSPRELSRANGLPQRVSFPTFFCGCVDLHAFAIPQRSYGAFTSR